ncbi:MAG: hypothetical protein AAB629_02590 [Patescibacteria group bacterium]
MYTLITIFYASFIAMIMMVLFKRREVNGGKQSVVSKIGAGTDHLFTVIFETLKRWISFVNKHTFIALAHLAAYHVLLRIRNVYVEIKHRILKNPHGKRLIDAVRGKGKISNHGASFYLRRIGGE